MSVITRDRDPPPLAIKSVGYAFNTPTFYTTTHQLAKYTPIILFASSATTGFNQSTASHLKLRFSTCKGLETDMTNCSAGFLRAGKSSEDC
jgi:hypothetical protein